MKKIALINDLSGFGRCSLAAAIPVISVMGVQACPLPTAILSAQTGFSDYFCDDYTDKMDCITKEWEKMNIDFAGIYSGYLASSGQIEKVLSFLEKFQQKNTIYIADPVMGDYGKPYDMFDDNFLKEMKELVLRADVITPNLTELCLLADVAYETLVGFREDKDYLERMKEMCYRLRGKAYKDQTVIVTGILRNTTQGEYVGNLVVSKDLEFFVESPYIGRGFSGTGDLFASVIAASFVKGLPVDEAVKKAADFLQLAIEDAASENIPSEHGVPFEKYLWKLA